MRVLVTGGAEYLGSILAKKLVKKIKKTNRVVILSNSYASRK
tara:strand:+ start:1228 stop:1353 length:126 start_codon:yes stop_codon:yes gene_type:complete